MEVLYEIEFIMQTLGRGYLMQNATITELQEGIRLHVLNSTKFKSILFGLYIRRPLNKDEVSLNALLTRVIDRATENHPGLTDLNRALEMLYGGVLVSDIHKYGEKQMIQIKMTVADGRRIGDPDVFRNALTLFNEILNAPKLVDGGFDPEIFKSAKEGLASEIEARKEDKTMWAVSKCLETMCEEEAYALHEYGTLSGLEAITPKSLYAHFLKVLKTSEMDIVILGDVETADMVTLVKEKLTFEREALTVIPDEQVVVPVKAVKEKQGALDVNQARLVMGYRMNIPYSSPAYLPAFIGTLILGHGGSSRLFKEVREKASLCYSTFARAERYKSVMFIYAGIDVQHFEEAKALILKEVAALKAGDIQTEEIEIATKAFISSLESVSDFPNSYINYYFNQYLSDGVKDIAAYIEKIKAVTKDEIIAALAHFELDTIVFLRKELTHVENK
jgi:predicted Zn-dependent peptidase